MRYDRYITRLNARPIYAPMPEEFGHFWESETRGCAKRQATEPFHTRSFHVVPSEASGPQCVLTAQENLYTGRRYQGISDITRWRRSGRQHTTCTIVLSHERADNKAPFVERRDFSLP